MFELVDSINDAPVIKLVGVGGGGCNAVQHMVQLGIEGVDFICANTDAQALKGMNAQTVLHIGQSITKGLGAGANPEIGRQAAMEDRDRIQDLIEGTDMLFITAGMGGGTGTGAIPVVAQIAREMGVLSAVQGIAELITNPGLINVDFADVRTVMSEMGLAMMGSGVGHGDERATEAAEMAISSPLLEDIDLAGARGILVNITAGMDMAIGEFEEVGNVVRSFAADDATVVVGTAIDESMEGELRVTVVATGLGQQQQQAQLQSVQRSVINGGPSYTNGAGSGRGAQAGHGAQASQTGPSGYNQGRQVRGNPTSHFQNYEKPAVVRKTAHGAAQGTGPATTGHDVEYLDIPAFLRRQAD